MAIEKKMKFMDKSEIVKILNEIGMMLEIKGESFFKSKAYYDAAREIELMGDDIETLVKEDRLKDKKGFGKALSKKVSELVSTGHLQYYEELKNSVPPGLLEMLKIPGLGPKRIKMIYDKLGISTIEELKAACIENNLIKIPGFGEKTQKKILEGIDNLIKYSGQHYFKDAKILSQEIMEALKKQKSVTRLSEAGSLRRKKEIVKDIDLLASSANPEEVMNVFTSHPLVMQVVSSGSTKSSVQLKGGIAADLRVVKDNEYPYALHHFTGSKEHNTALRHIAKENGLKINEYGVFQNNELIKCETEEDIFKIFGMSYIPPELRENNGELQAAKDGKLPVLVEHKDIKGIFHIHTLYGDGINTIDELAEACIKKGYAYMGITDHSRSAYYAGGLKEEDIKIQHDEIDKLNKKYGHSGFKIFKGIELDILPDGSVDYDEKTLSLFDFTIASIHSALNMDEERMTKRVIEAMKNKYVKILGHPTGRLLLLREPIKININEIIKTAAEENVVIEINSNPYRMDLDWRYCKQAKEAGCKFIISPDAHSIEGINDVEYGVNIARKGWLEKENIINMVNAEKILKMMK